MAFPASTQNKIDAFSLALRTATRLKSFAQSARDMMAVQDVSASQLLQVVSEFKSGIEAFDAAAATPGIVQHAKDVFEDPALDIAAEFNAMRAAAVAVRDRVIGDVPVAAGGYMLIQQFEADGAITVRQFTTAQTANLRTDLDAFIATVI